MKNFPFHLNASAFITMLGIAYLIESSALAGEAEPSAASFEETIAQFTKLAPTDKNLGALLEKHQLTIECAVTNHGTYFYVGCDGKKTVSGLGHPKQPSELTLSADSRVLVRYLSGENCESKIQIKAHLGLAKRISLQHDIKDIRAALRRVYAEANRIASATEQPRLAQRIVNGPSSK
jgi:hypothetical protein